MGWGELGSAWVHLPGGDPDPEDGAFRERVQKGWEKERPTQCKSKREASYPREQTMPQKTQ